MTTCIPKVMFNTSLSQNSGRTTHKFTYFFPRCQHLPCTLSLSRLKTCYIHSRYSDNDRTSQINPSPENGKEQTAVFCQICGMVTLTYKTGKSQKLERKGKLKVPTVWPRRKFQLFTTSAVSLFMHFCVYTLCTHSLVYCTLWIIPRCSELLKQLSRSTGTVKTLWYPVGI